MKVAPQPLLAAYLAVVRAATIYARSYGWRGQNIDNTRERDELFEQISDLMDAVHVIPELLDDWDRCDEPALRRNFLEAYDQKWKDKGPSLIRIFEEAFEKASRESTS